MSVGLDELTSLRSDLAGMAMPDTCTVQRATYGEADPYGGSGEATWADWLIGVPCAYWQTGGRTSLAEREAVIESQRVVLPHDTSIRENDRLVNIRDAGGVLRTQSVLRIDAIARREAVIECDVTEVSWEAG